MRLMTLPRRALWQTARKGLGEKDRRAQIDVEMGLPAVPVERLDLIPLEAGGIVDETGEGAELGGATLDQRLERLQPGEIGGEGGCLSAFGLDLRHDVKRVCRGSVIMDADAPAAIREIECNRPAEPARSAGHENGRGSLVLSHASFDDFSWPNRIVKAEARRPGLTLSEHLSRNKAKGGGMHTQGKHAPIKPLNC